MFGNFEIWKDVLGYEEYFRISSEGRLFSKRTNRILKLTLHPNGYWVVSTRIGGRKEKAIAFKVHRLVAQAFVPNPENKPIVNHKDCDKQNNYYENLEWVTYGENIKHAYLNDRFPKIDQDGEKNPSSKLKEHQVIEIRKYYHENLEKTSKNKINIYLSGLYNISIKQIRDICSGKSWNYLL